MRHLQSSLVCGILVAALDPDAHPIPDRLGGGRSVRINQGAVAAASRRARNLPSIWRSRVVKPVTRPRHAGLPFGIT
jgi:hypothetical protein